ncbi:MAG: DinB family protein [Alphaproteobacteria bacterium]
MMADYFRRLAGYNAWANRRLYDACASLSEAEYRKKRPAFFRSIHGTLNHLMVADRVWMGRIEGVDPGIKALDQILYDDLPGLRAAREAEDARIAAFVAPLGDGEIGQVVRYHTVSQPEAEMATPLHLILGHMFNHETHHRGQVHGLLSQTEVPPPPLDFIFYLRQTA